jgi:hypothetical protein
MNKPFGAIMNEHDLAESTFYWRNRAEEYLRSARQSPDPVRTEWLAKLAAAYSAAMNKVENTSGPAVNN